MASLALVIAGCVGATPGSSSVPGSPSAAPAASASPSAAPTSAAPAESAAQSDAATSTADPSIGDSLKNVPQAPNGTWTSIHWTALPTLDALDGTSRPTGSIVQVFGWSRGYVAFTIAPDPATGTPDASTGDYISNPPSLVASYSTDGIHWHAGQKLDTKAAGTQDLQVMRTVLEGPSGLLAVGWSGGCASENLDSLWTSTDGITWKPVNAAKVFGDNKYSIQDVSGGAAGFVATAYRDSGAWTSKDGRTWKKVAQSSAAFANSRVNDGTAFSGGFVLVGASGTPDCAVSVSDGSTPKPVFWKASAWWSADGSTWKQESLPGAASSSNPQSIWTARLSDGCVLAFGGTYAESSSTQFAWATKDGRTWTAMSMPADIDRGRIISNASHNLLVSPAMSTDSNGYANIVPGPMSLRTIDDSLTLVTVSQTGSVPAFLYQNGPMGTYGLVAIGPTGVVATSPDGSLWFGQPSTD